MMTEDFKHETADYWDLVAKGWLLATFFMVGMLLAFTGYWLRTGEFGWAAVICIVLWNIAAFFYRRCDRRAKTLRKNHGKPPPL